MLVKKWAKYFIYLLAGVLYLAVIELAYKAVVINQQISANMALLITVVLSVVYGVLLSLSHLLAERKKIGKWKVNFPILILIVIPLFVFSAFPFFYNTVSLHKLYPDIIVGRFQYVINDPILQSISQLLFVYFLLTSFGKE